MTDKAINPEDIKIHCNYGKLKENQKEYYNGQRLVIKIGKGTSTKALEELKQQILSDRAIVERLKERIKEVKTNYPIIADELQSILDTGVKK